MTPDTPYRTNFVVFRDDVPICVHCKHIRWQGVEKLCAAAPPEKIEPCEIDPVTGYKRGGVTRAKCVDVNVDGQCERFERYVPERPAPETYEHTPPSFISVALGSVVWALFWSAIYVLMH